MNRECISWALKQKTGNAIRKSILIHLAFCTSEKSWECRPRIKLICEETEISESAVKRALKDLAEANFIEIAPQFNQGARIENGYRIIGARTTQEGGSRVNPPQGSQRTHVGSQRTHQVKRRAAKKGDSQEEMDVTKAESADAKEAQIPAGAKAFIDIWNEAAAQSGLAKIQEWTDKRAKKLKALAQTYKGAMSEIMKLAIAECHKSAWCIQNKANVDHILRPDNFQRYLDNARTEKKEVEEKSTNTPKWKIEKIAALNKIKAIKEKELAKAIEQGRQHSANLMKKEIESIDIEIGKL